MSSPVAVDQNGHKLQIGDKVAVTVFAPDYKRSGQMQTVTVKRIYRTDRLLVEDAEKNEVFCSSTVVIKASTTSKTKKGFFERVFAFFQ